jgi:broad-specificity NMP kinase
LSYVDTTHKTPEQVQEEVFKIIKGEENAKWKSVSFLTHMQIHSLQK